MGSCIAERSPKKERTAPLPPRPFFFPAWRGRKKESETLFPLSNSPSRHSFCSDKKMNRGVLVPGSVLAPPEPGKHHVRFFYMLISLSRGEGGRESKRRRSKVTPFSFFVDDGGGHSRERPRRLFFFSTSTSTPREKHYSSRTPLSFSLSLSFFPPAPKIQGTITGIRTRRSDGARIASVWLTDHRLKISLPLEEALSFLLAAPQLPPPPRRSSRGARPRSRSVPS